MFTSHFSPFNSHFSPLNSHFQLSLFTSQLSLSPLTFHLSTFTFPSHFSPFNCHFFLPFSPLSFNPQLSLSPPTFHPSTLTFTSGCMKDKISLPRLKINFTESHLHAKQDTMQEICMETRLDDELASLMHVIVNGWPETIKELAPALKSYWTFREELTVENGMVLKDTCIVIPHKMRKRILNQLYEGHLGEHKCQAKTAQTVYWPNISEDIAQFVLNCPTCLKYSNQK